VVHGQDRLEPPAPKRRRQNLRGATSFTNEVDVVVYLDRTRIGGRASLRSIQASNAERLRCYNARRATARY
jgi:hypothetical protein